MRRLPFPLISLLLMTAFATEAAAQLDGPALMREGNALFRSGLYRAALLRYQEARVRGLSSALLDYNVGVARYKVGDYAAAERALLDARREPQLAPLAAYNLGLTLRATGRTAEAQQWFTTTADTAPNRELRALARSALQSLLGPADTPPPSRSSAARTRGEPRMPQLKVMLDAGYGHDDNVNRAPADAYVDLAQPGQPVVTPVPVAAPYVAMRAVARYLIPNEAGDTDFYVGYRLDGQYYTDELANDESTQRIELGADAILGENDNRKRTLRTAFFVTRHFQRNVDPDTGLDREIQGLDISRRFFYTGAGIRGDFDHYVGDWRWGLNMRFERREHERVPLVANYDNELYLVNASVGYSLSSRTGLSLSLNSYRRLYDERQARDLNGALLGTSPALKYGYQGIELGFTRRLLENFELEVGYARLERTDRFVGYNDYSQDRLRVHGTVRPGRRFELSFGAVSRTYDYPNAFAFNDPTAGPRELDDVAAELLAEVRISDTLSIFGELRTDDLTSTDSRVEHSRAQTVLGLTWRR